MVTSLIILFSCGLVVFFKTGMLPSDYPRIILDAPTQYERQYVYNAANQLTKEAAETYEKLYSYDPNGNNTTIVTTGASAGTTTMTYDSLNRQTSWTDGTSTETTAYRGAEWHRASTTANGTTTQYMYDGDNVVADLVGGAYDKLYVTPFLDQNLSMTDATTGKTHYYTHDGLGSVRTLTDALGNVENRYDYTAFGETFSATTSETVDNRYTYTGRELNGLSGLYNHRNRQSYDPMTGRFGQRDDIGGYYFNEWGNLYDYVYAQPNIFTDPFGLGAETEAELLKAIRSHAERVAEHIKKLKDYASNPEAFDNKGKLKDVSDAVRKKIIEGRKETLRQTIAKHRNEIAKLKNKLARLRGAGGSSSGARGGSGAGAGAAGAALYAANAAVVVYFGSEAYKDLEFIIGCRAALIYCQSTAEGQAPNTSWKGQTFDISYMLIYSATYQSTCRRFGCKVCATCLTDSGDMWVCEGE